MTDCPICHALRSVDEEGYCNAHGKVVKIRPAVTAGKPPRFFAERVQSRPAAESAPVHQLAVAAADHQF